MIEKNKVIENVKKSTSFILKFLGYAKRIPPKIVEKKIVEELEKFQDYIDIEYEYRIYRKEEVSYADVIFTIGDRLEKVINSYINSGEAMRAMIMDKIGVVTLDKIKEEIIKEIFIKYDLNVIKEIYPGSSKYPIDIQKEILDEMENIKSISINKYFQLYPLKTVAIKMILSYENKFYNPCEDCENPCEAFKITEEEAYKYFLEKAETYTKKIYEQENIPEEVYEDNIRDIDIWSDKYEKEHGRKGFYKEQFEWIDSILEMKVIKLGRLQFEILEHIDKKFENILGKRKNILFINVHIREGENLCYEECEKSYNMAKKYYTSKGYKFSKIIFICDSWLINPDLNKLLSENSNIIKFQKRYKVISVSKNEERPQIIERVYGNSLMKSDEFSQNTTLQIKLKKAWERGERFPVAKGYFIYE